MNIQSVEIKNLEDLVGTYIDKNKKIVGKKISSLTAPGENFGSTILKLDLTLQADNEKTEELSIVAKLIPNLEFFQKIFNVEVTFKLEAAFYDVIIPTLQNFQREQGIEKVVDFFPKFYGARMNLNGSDKIDSDAVILLENLKISGLLSNLDLKDNISINVKTFAEITFKRLVELCNLEDYSGFDTIINTILAIKEYVETIEFPCRQATVIKKRQENGGSLMLTESCTTIRDFY